MSAANEADIFAERHLHYFMQLAETAETEMTGPAQGEWLKRLEAEHDNLRAALNWRGAGADRVQAQMCMAGALWRFWHAPAHVAEGQKFLEAALAQSVNTDTPSRAKGFSGLGTIAWLRGDYRLAVTRQEQALALYREVGDMRGAALALVNIGGLYIFLAEYERGAPFLQESLLLSEQLGDRHLLTIVLTSLGELERFRGALDKAEEYHRQALAVAQEIQHWLQIALSLNNLGFVATQRGNFDAAIELHQQGLALYPLILAIRFVPEWLEGLAAAWNEVGQSHKAAVLLGASDALRAENDLPVPPMERPQHTRALERVRAALGAEFETAWTQGRAFTTEETLAYALGKT